MTGAGNGHILAIGVGSGELRAGVVDPAGTIMASARSATPRQATAAELLSAVGFVAEAALSDWNPAGTITGIGVGCAGPMQWPAGRVSPLSLPQWREFPLAQLLAERFGLPVRIHNEAICLTVGEHRGGAGRGYENVLGVMLGMGIGGGLVLGGRLHHGSSGNAGHIGHVVVDPLAGRCRCGGHGCLEVVLGWFALQRAVQQRGRDLASVAALVSAARAGDPVVMEVLAGGGRLLGRALADAAALLDLDLVTLGGPICSAGPEFLDSVLTGYREHARLSYLANLRIVLAGPDAVLTGAAALWSVADGYWPADTLSE